MTYDIAGHIRWNPPHVGLFTFWWAVNTGKRLNQAEALRERVDKVANVHRLNREEDEELDRQIQNAGDNPSPVRAPWLRKRN